MAIAYRIAADMVGKWLKVLRTCRMCGNRVRPTDDICPNCGASDPVVVPIWTALLIMLITVFAGTACVLIMLWLL